MRRHRTRRLGIAGMGLLMWVAVGSVARADDDVVVAVVEVNGGGADAGTVRAKLGEALGVPVVSVLDGAGGHVRGTLTIAADFRRGEARVVYRRGDETFAWSSARVPRAAPGRMAWIVDHAVAVVNAAEPRGASRPPDTCLEVIDPWRYQGRRAVRHAFGYRLPPEVLDPFVEPGRRATVLASYRLPSEVLDPWADASGGAGSSSRTRP